MDKEKVKNMVIEVLKGAVVGVPVKTVSTKSMKKALKKAKKLKKSQTGAQASEKELSEMLGNGFRGKPGAALRKATTGAQASKQERRAFAVEKALKK